MELGFRPDDFWSQTPRRLQLIFTAKGRALTRAQDERMHQAWHIGAFGRIDKFPDLSTVLSAGAQRPQTPEDVQRQIMAWLGSPPSQMEH